VARPLDVLFRDEAFIAVAKPAGVPVHGGARVKTQTVVERMDGPIHPVHRLDAGTSGVLLLARSSEAAGRASRRWAEAEKRYLAWVVGTPRATTLDAPLPDAEGRVRPAKTHVRPLSVTREGDAALVAVALETGRTHQIRRHLAGAGHPVLMDDRHGDFEANKAFRRRVRSHGAPNPKHVLLHAHVLAWAGRRIVAPIPDRWPAWAEAIGLSLDGLDDALGAEGA